MNEQFNDNYLWNYSETHRARLMEEAERARQKARLLAAARQQKPVKRRSILRGVPTLARMLRAAIPRPAGQKADRHCAELEPTPLS